MLFWIILFAPRVAVAAFGAGSVEHAKLTLQDHYDVAFLRSQRLGLELRAHRQANKLGQTLLQPDAHAKKQKEFEEMKTEMARLAADHRIIHHRPHPDHYLGPTTGEDEIAMARQRLKEREKKTEKCLEQGCSRSRVGPGKTHQILNTVKKSRYHGLVATHVKGYLDDFQDKYSIAQRDHRRESRSQRPGPSSHQDTAMKSEGALVKSESGALVKQKQNAPHERMEALRSSFRPLELPPRVADRSRDHSKFSDEPPTPTATDLRSETPTHPHRSGPSRQVSRPSGQGSAVRPPAGNPLVEDTASSHTHRNSKGQPLLRYPGYHRPQPEGQQGHEKRQRVEPSQPSLSDDLLPKDQKPKTVKTQDPKPLTLASKKQKPGVRKQQMEEPLFMKQTQMPIKVQNPWPWHSIQGQQYIHNQPSVNQGAATPEFVTPVNQIRTWGNQPTAHHTNLMDPIGFGNQGVQRPLQDTRNQWRNQFSGIPNRMGPPPNFGQQPLPQQFNLAQGPPHGQQPFMSQHSLAPTGQGQLHGDPIFINEGLLPHPNTHQHTPLQPVHNQQYQPAEGLPPWMNQHQQQPVLPLQPPYHPQEPTQDYQSLQHPGQQPGQHLGLQQPPTQQPLGQPRQQAIYQQLLQHGQGQAPPPGPQTRGDQGPLNNPGDPYDVLPGLQGPQP